MRFDGETARRIGDEHEALVIQAFALECDWPPWLLYLRAADRTEDAGGVDVIAALDTGKLGFQVKSSHELARQFHVKHPDIPVVIVSLTDSSERVRKKLRRLFKAARSGRLVSRMVFY